MVNRVYDVDTLKDKSQKGGIDTTTESGRSEEARRPGSFSASFSASFSGGNRTVVERPFVPVYTLDPVSSSDVERNLSSDITFSPYWYYQRRGRTSSSRTGPGANNQRPFIFFETSGGLDARAPANSFFTIDGGSLANLEVVSWLQSSNSRKLAVDVCNMGSGIVGGDGLYLWSSDTEPNFTGLNIRQKEIAVRNLRRDSIGGWTYSDFLTIGNTITTVRGFPTLPIRYNGGWVRWVVDVPDNHQYVGLFADLGTGFSSFRSDIAITAIQLMEQQ